MVLILSEFALDNSNIQQEFCEISFREFQWKTEKQMTSDFDYFKSRNFINVNTLALKCQERSLTDDEESQN